MELLPASLRRQLPALNSQKRRRADDKIVYARFFFPQADWTWFVVEGEPIGDDYHFYGYEVGFLAEWKCFTLSELKKVHSRGLRVQRDGFFESGEFSKVISEFRRERGY